MRDHNANQPRPEMHWVEVVDAHGRARLEMRWTVEPHTQAPAPHAAA